MKNVFKMFFCLVVFIMGCGIRSGTVKAADVDKDLIKGYYELVNAESWDALLDTLGDEYAAAMRIYLESDDYIDNRLGVYCIESVGKVEVIGDVDSAVYQPIVDECEGEDIRIYLVGAELSLYKENDFFNDGMNYNLFFVSTIEGERKIAAYRMPLPETVETCAGFSEAEEYSVFRFGAGSAEAQSADARSVCSYNSLPATVKVKRWCYGDGSVATVDLKEYVKTVACGEAGYVSRKEAYHYACALAIRNYTWYHIVTADSNAQYHVTDTSKTKDSAGNKYKSYQKYDPDSYWNNSTWKKLYDRVDAIWDVSFFDSDRDRVFSWYTTESGKGTQSSGRMNLNTAYTLSKEGKDYQQILNYFYGNTSSSKGDLYFCNIGEHVSSPCKCGNK